MDEVPNHPAVSLHSGNHGCHLDSSVAKNLGNNILIPKFDNGKLRELKKSHFFNNKPKKDV